jgi:serine/threonine protein kinase
MRTSVLPQAGCSDYRDLKLENILLDKSENIKLVDFGFTREYDPRKLLETWCGTYAYAAPEMIQGQKYSGEGTNSISLSSWIAVDVWSMGVILYTLLCGELPFDDDDESKTKLRIVKKEYKLPDYLSPGN